MYGLHKSQGALDFIAPTGPIFVTPSQCPEEVPGQDVMLEGYIRLRLERRRKVRSISIELKADAQLRSKDGTINLTIAQCRLDQPVRGAMLEAGLHVFIIGASAAATARSRNGQVEHFLVATVTASSRFCLPLVAIQPIHVVSSLRPLGAPPAHLAYRVSGAAPDLGPYAFSLSCESHVGGSFDFTLSLPSSAPHVQLHSLVVYLRQIVHFDQTYATPCTTEEDLQSRLATLERCTPNLFLLVQETTCVPSSTFPVASPSGCRFHTTGRLPTCNEASASSERLLPSTPFGSRTPLRISHEMVISVDFTSIEENGKRSAKMRVQSVKRCKIASCAAVGEAMVSLPMYEEVEKPVVVEEKPVACACENPLGLVPEREVEEVGAERRGEKVSL